MIFLPFSCGRISSTEVNVLPYKKYNAYYIKKIFSTEAAMNKEFQGMTSKEVKQRGIAQFIGKYFQHKDRENDPFTWGDEIEYMIVRFDANKKTVKLSQTAKSVLSQLCQHNKSEDGNENGEWRNEYLKCMVESSPSKPYNDNLNEVDQVEISMVLRREELTEILQSNEVPLTISLYPRFFCNAMTDPDVLLSSLCRYQEDGGPCNCVLTDDDRYHKISYNIQNRRQRPIEISRKVLKDVKTTCENVQIDLSFKQYSGCSLQVTFQTSNLTQARLVLDQLASLAPYMVDKNMGAADKLDAVLKEKFCCRTKVFTEDTPRNVKRHFDKQTSSYPGIEVKQFEERSLNDIFSGFNKTPGLIQLIEFYINDKGGKLDKIQPYLQLIFDRATGKKPTTASFIRDFVMKHPEYKQDSVVTETINYDLLKILAENSQRH